MSAARPNAGNRVGTQRRNNFEREEASAFIISIDIKIRVLKLLNLGNKNIASKHFFFRSFLNGALGRRSSEEFEQAIKRPKLVSCDKKKCASFPRSHLHSAEDVVRQEIGSCLALAWPNQ